jgi:glycosyltransferase involved in cell wall biosynthesis
MKILWVKSDFLHPATRGGRIRTLEILRRLHQKHEIHYAAYLDPAHPDAPALSREYCSRAYPVQYRIPAHGTWALYVQAAAGLFRSLPVTVERYGSSAMRLLLGDLRRRLRFDRIVCDFIAPALNLERLEECVLFQHNVETMIWRRHAETASNPALRLYMRLQARRMFEFEKNACRTAGAVVAVSPVDAAAMRSLFGIGRIFEVPTGVDVGYFTPPPHPEPVADLVFVGAMDWLPNIDAAVYFASDILPLIRRRRPGCSVAFVGRVPQPRILALASDPLIRVTGTVPDVRPYFWGAKVSIVPLRIGGGTRLKIYEAMAANSPIVSTTIGAEGLTVSHPDHLHLADTPEAFADACLALLEDEPGRQALRERARQLVSSRFSWDCVAEDFEEILRQAPGPAMS